MNKTEIYISKRCRIVLPSAISNVHNIVSNAALVYSFQKNLESLGYILHPAVADALTKLNKEQIIDVYNNVITACRKIVGAHRVFKPMYPNFPSQVAEASDLELYVNAMLHYTSAMVSDATGMTFVILPAYDKFNRPILNEEVKLKVITQGSDGDFDDIFTTLCSANSSISASDKEILAWFINSKKEAVLDLVPEVIPQKETLAFVLSNAIAGIKDCSPLVDKLKTATDVLRVAVGMNGGDVSLAAPTRFARMNRPTRKFFLACLEKAGNITEDMLRHSEQWKRLSRELRPGDYANKFPKAYSAFDVLRNDKPYETYNSGVEKALASGTYHKAIELLETRPGDFVRRLDHLLRESGRGITVIRKLRGCISKVSTPVLVQAFNHFAYRQKEEKQRVFFPKGNVANIQLIEEGITKMDAGLAATAAGVIRGELVKRFASLPELGDCYVDESLKTQLVPFALRSASKALKTIARGSRMPLEDKNVVRLFLWWKNLESTPGNYGGRVDVDLSALFLGKNFENRGQVSYYALRGNGCYHSGDITNAPNGACEFIDLDRKSLMASGTYYVAMCVNMYSGQPFCNLPECFAGWMTRAKANSGEVFEPKTIDNKVDLAADTTIAIPAVFDVANNQVIWLDLALKDRGYVNNVQGNKGNISKLVKAMVDLNRPNLYDLFMMHVEARGKRVYNKIEADTVFSFAEGVTPFNTDLILSEYLK